MGSFAVSTSRWVRTIAAGVALATMATACTNTRPPLDREAFVAEVEARGYTTQQSNCIVNRLISVYGDRVYGTGQIESNDPVQVERYVRAYAESC